MVCSMKRTALVTVLLLNFLFGYICSDFPSFSTAGPIECCATGCRVEVSRRVAAASCASSEATRDPSLKASHDGLSLLPPLSLISAAPLALPLLPSARSVEAGSPDFSGGPPPLYLLNSSLLL